MDADWSELEKALMDMRAEAEERQAMTPQMRETDDRLSEAKSRFEEAVRSLPKDPETPIAAGLAYQLVSSAVEMNRLYSYFLALLHDEDIRRFKESYKSLVNQLVPMVNTHHQILKQITAPLIADVAEDS